MRISMLFVFSLNHNLPEQEWQITCIQLAPYAPEQNPVEDIWLQALYFCPPVLYVVQLSSYLSLPLITKFFRSPRHSCTIFVHNLFRITVA